MADVEYAGLFEEWWVVVVGRTVPLLTADPLLGRVDLALDHRHGLILDLETAERVVPCVANAIAIAMGYISHPRPPGTNPVQRPPFPRL